jgi:hypothetical protein
MGYYTNHKPKLDRSPGDPSRGGPSVDVRLLERRGTPDRAWGHKREAEIPPLAEAAEEALDYGHKVGWTDREDSVHSWAADDPLVPNTASKAETRTAAVALRSEEVVHSDSAAPHPSLVSSASPSSRGRAFPKQREVAWRTREQVHAKPF